MKAPYASPPQPPIPDALATTESLLAEIVSEYPPRRRFFGEMQISSSQTVRIVKSGQLTDEYRKLPAGFEFSVMSLTRQTNSIIVCIDVSEDETGLAKGVDEDDVLKSIISDYMYEVIADGGVVRIDTYD